MRIEYGKNSKTLIADEGKVLQNKTEVDILLYAVTMGLNDPEDDWIEIDVEVEE